METTQSKILNYLIEHGPKLVTAIVIVVAGIIVSGIIGRLAQGWLDRRALEPPVRMLISRIIRLLVLSIFVVIALGTAGVDVTALIAGIGVVGVGVGLAMQGVLGNLVAGLLIIFTKPFRVGEYIEIVGCYGQVNRIELFNTTLVHPDKSRVVIPNRKIAGEILHNYGTIRQHDIIVGVAYNTNLPQAIGIVQNLLKAHPRILKDPAPVVVVKDFADSAINIAVLPWSNLSEFGPTAAELKIAIIEAFRANRIEIPFPQREVRVLNAAPALAS